MNRWTWVFAVSLILNIIVLPFFALLLKIADDGWFVAIWLVLLVSLFLSAGMSQRRSDDDAVTDISEPEVRGVRPLGLWVLLALLGWGLILLALDDQISLWIGLGYFCVLAIIGLAIFLLSRRSRRS